MLLLFCSTVASAQHISLKSNLLYLATSTPNFGLELALGDRWTFEFEGGYNPWNLDTDNNMKIKHWLVSPEFRYWFCNSFQGHFIGINGNYTRFNAGSIPFEAPRLFIYPDNGRPEFPDMQKSRIEGWAAGAGMTYGYAFPIARKWNLEFTVGYGLWYTVYSQYESRKCGLFQQTVQKRALGPTSAGISFVYMIK